MLLKLPSRILASSMYSSRFFIPVFALLAAVCLYGQFESGAILGTVHDPSGASVPNATVTLENTKTAVVGTKTFLHRTSQRVRFFNATGISLG